MRLPSPLGSARMTARLAEIRPFLDERAWRLLLGAEARAIGSITVIDIPQRYRLISDEPE